VDSDDTATDDDLPPVENDGSNCKVDFSVRNRALLQENRRLQELVDEYEQKLRVGGREDIAKTSQHTEKTSNTKSTSVAIGEDEDDDTAEDSVYKLKGKIKALKAKRRSEKLNLLQMQKNVDTHTAEIAGLQRELNRALTELEELQQERVGDKNKIRELMKQLNAGRRHVTDDTDNNIVKQLKQDLQKRDGELEVTLELLQSKVERIMQLEFELEKGKEKLQKTERRVEDLIKRNSVPGTEGQSFQSVELISAEAEIKSLRRQNMMLKLVVEELQEARRRRSDSDIDIDSVFLKLPPEMQEEIPHSVGLLGSLCLPDEEMSVGTDLLSVGANQLPKPDPRVT
jgi:chromosome segregation ATPase